MARPISSCPTHPRVAVLYQAVEPPIINGVRKPMKPGGYQDSGADIAFVLRQNNHSVVTEKDSPDPNHQEGWCFPDTEEGILRAISKGATHLWANTILFSSHPLQTSTALSQYASRLKIVGQPPQLVDQYDDKDFVNSLLRKDGRFTLPKSWIVSSSTSASLLNTLPYPIVGKPIRGRGSHGVKVCYDSQSLAIHLEHLLSESSLAMLEIYLPGEEGTVTIMPPSDQIPNYWALPIVLRFNHDAGIAPYNGVVAVTSNSRVPSDYELASNSSYAAISDQCVLAAERLNVTAPIRIDVRRIQEQTDAPFALFDVNMKPNMTGPGRPGREDQASLTALAAARLGWDYPDLLERVLNSAQTLETLRTHWIDRSFEMSEHMK